MKEQEYLEHYLRTIRNVDPIDEETERDLLARARAGDRDAFREVVWQHLERAFELAQELKPDWLGPLDAAQEANVALTRLVEKSSVADIRSTIEPAIREWFEKRVPRERPG